MALSDFALKNAKPRLKYYRLANGDGSTCWRNPVRRAAQARRRQAPLGFRHELI